MDSNYENIVYDVEGEEYPELGSPMDVEDEEDYGSNFSLEDATMMDVETDDDEVEDIVVAKPAPYASHKATFVKGNDHPQALCEGSGLACVNLPKRTYFVRMRRKYYTGSEGKISNAQLEAISYCMQSFENFFSISGTLYRQGFFLGDGTGVGKSRTLAGVIKELWISNVQKVIWFTPSLRLSASALEEIKIFIPGILAWNLGDVPSDFVFERGVLFSTYALIGRPNNQAKLQEAIGDNFDGLVIFDEAHLIKRVKRKTVSAVHSFAMEIQESFPNARVIYSSATGASQPEHLGYMQRLHLWGEGTNYLLDKDFVEKIESGGICILEMLAMDLKRRGIFFSRHISFEGVRIFKSNATATATFKEIYRRSTVVWAIMLQYLMEKKAKGFDVRPQVLSTFFCNALNFFESLILSSKIREISKITRDSLEAGSSVIIGLRSTGEHHFDSFLKQSGNLGFGYSNCASILRHTLKAMDIEVGFPRTYSKTHGALRIGNWQENNEEAEEGAVTESDILDSVGSHVDNFSRNPIMSETLSEIASFNEIELQGYMTWSLGAKPLIIEANDLCWSAKEIAQSGDITAENLARLYHEVFLLLPVNPLDELLNRLNEGEDESIVANCTGKRNWYRFDETTEAWDKVDEERSIDGVDEFMDLKKRICVISDATSVGVSLHADPLRPNQQQRVHITMQIPFSPEKFIQQLGRSHRSNQVTPPEYYLVLSPFMGEMRFAALQASRLQQMGAICDGYGEAKSVKEEMFGELGTSVALVAVINAVEYLIRNNATFAALWGIVGFKLSRTRRVDGPDQSHAKLARFYNRVMFFDEDMQRIILTEVSRELDQLIEEGELSYSYMRAYPLDNRALEKQEEAIYPAPQGNEVTLSKFLMHRTQSWTEMMTKLDEKDNPLIFRSMGMIGVVSCTVENKFGVYYPYTKELVMKDKKTIDEMEPLDLESGKAAWDNMVERLMTTPGCWHRWNAYRSCKNPNICGSIEVCLLSGPLYLMYETVKTVFDTISLAKVDYENKSDVGILIPPEKYDILKNILSLKKY